MKLKLFLLGALTMSSLWAQDDQPFFRQSIGFAAGNVSGIGMSYQLNLTRNFATQAVIGGVAQKSNSDFNVGLSTRYTFSRITKYIGIYALTGGSFFYDRKRTGIYDETSGQYGPDRVRKYLRIGGGLGIQTYFFDGRLGLDFNFIGLGASYQKREKDKEYGFGDKPIRGPQVTLSYHF